MTYVERLWELKWLPSTLACMTGALWAKRGERDISRGARHEREARDEGKRKIKLYFSLPLVSLLPFRRKIWSKCMPLTNLIILGTFILGTLRRQQERHKFAYLIVKNNSFARFVLAVVIFDIRRRSRSFCDVKWPVSGTHQMEPASPLKALGVNPFPSRFINYK